MLKNSKRIVKEKGLHAVDLKELQKLCTFVADYVPVNWSDTIRRPWGCILTTRKVFQYCNKCLAENLCPYPRKQWSK